MRVTGRFIRASTLAERRLLLSLGSTAIRVPRSINPYSVARRLSRGAASDVLFARELLSQLCGRPKESTANADAPVD